MTEDPAKTACNFVHLLRSNYKLVAHNANVLIKAGFDGNRMLQTASPAVEGHGGLSEIVLLKGESMIVGIEPRAQAICQLTPS